jgi:hypothetical protein
MRVYEMLAMKLPIKFGVPMLDELDEHTKRYVAKVMVRRVPEGDATTPRQRLCLLGEMGDFSDLAEGIEGAMRKQVLAKALRKLYPDIVDPDDLAAVWRFDWKLPVLGVEHVARALKIYRLAEELRDVGRD